MCVQTLRQPTSHAQTERAWLPTHTREPGAVTPDGCRATQWHQRIIYYRSLKKILRRCCISYTCEFFVPHQCQNQDIVTLSNARWTFSTQGLRLLTSSCTKELLVEMLHRKSTKTGDCVHVVNPWDQILTIEILSHDNLLHSYACHMIPGGGLVGRTWPRDHFWGGGGAIFMSNNFFQLQVVQVLTIP